MKLRRFRALKKLISVKFSRGLSLYARVLFCFAVGFVVLLATDQGNYDLRLSVRGAQPVGDDIILINLGRDDVVWMDTEISQHSKNVMWSLKEIVETSDSFYWHPLLWSKAISKLKQADCEAILVTLFFGEETVHGTMTMAEQQLFHKVPVFWAAKSDPDGHAITPGLANNDGKNIGTVELRPDPDGKVRHFLSVSNLVNNLGLSASRYVRSLSDSGLSHSHIGELINFQGVRGTFKAYSFSDLLNGRIDPQNIKNRIVIFGLSDVVTHQFQTPVGPMATNEILANVIYSFTHNKWIVPVPLWISTLFLLFVLIVSIYTIFQYPQSVAFVFLILFSAAIMALSTAMFDLKSVWVPAEAAVATVLVSYVVISGYRLTESEKFSWVAEKELLYLSEIESLKNNFLSLISHDLKNPLAKIQGITDRLLSVRDQNITPEIKEDLNNIMQTSDELRQYISSILKLTSVESRNIKLTKEVCDVNAVILEVIGRLKPLADHRHIDINQSLEPLFTMEIDRVLIAEVVTNLVENAIKYSKDGGKVYITSQEVGDEVKVEVSDQGGGIPVEEISKVFDKFYRGAGDKTRLITGTGLGLYLVKYFIELHGGKVFINSQVGVGTHVGFTLPLDEPEESYANFTRSHR